MTSEFDNDALFKRQLGFYNPWERKDDEVHIIGLGGIGSFAAFGIAKLGVPNITVVDDDTVEQHNVPNQFHGLFAASQSQPKVESMQYLCSTLAGTDITTIEGQIGENSPNSWDPHGVVISGVDSMAARKAIWQDGQIKYNRRVSHYFDARIAGQLIVVYAVNPTDPDDCKSYEKTLHSDDESEPAPCTERGVIDVGLMVGAILTNMTRHALTGRDIPSVTSFNMAQPPVTSGDWVL